MGDSWFTDPNLLSIISDTEQRSRSPLSASHAEGYSFTRIRVRPLPMPPILTTTGIVSIQTNLILPIPDRVSIARSAGTIAFVVDFPH